MSFNRREIASMKADIDALRKQIEGRAGRLTDAELIAAIETGTATPAQIRRLAKDLRPFVRGYLYRLALIFYGERLRGEPLGFGPCEPMECAAVITSYLPGEAPPQFVLDHLAYGPHYRPDLWSYRSTEAGILHSFRHWVQGVVVLEAIGEPTCLEMRATVAGMIKTNVLAPEVRLVPGQRELDITAPMNVPMYESGLRFNVISRNHLDGTPIDHPAIETTTM